MVDGESKEGPGAVSAGGSLGSGSSDGSGGSGGSFRSAAGGGLSLWIGTLAYAGSTVALLAVLSHHAHHSKFSGLAALVSFAFVVSLIPAGMQLRSASLVADGHPAPAMSARQAVAVTAVSLAISPLLAFLLHVPVIAIGLVSVQMVIAIPLAAKQGAALARRRFLPLGLNLVLEGAARFILGAVAGWFLGEIGLAAGLCAGTLVALLALSNRGEQVTRQNRPRTSLLDTSLTLALVGLYVQLDILVAPSILHNKSSLYDLAAVPSKGVYVVLLAAGPLVFPFIRRRQDGNRLIVLSSLVVLGAGLVCTAVIATLLPLIAVILGQPRAHVEEFLLVGAAMAFAGVTGVVTTSSVARGVKRPWPPPLIGMAVVMLSWPFRPSVLTFAIVVAAGQGLTCVLCLVNCIWGRRGEPEGPPSGDLRPVESLAEAGDLLATAQGAQQLEQADPH